MKTKNHRFVWDGNVRRMPDFKIDYDTHRHSPIKRFNFRMKYLMRYNRSMSPCNILVYRTKKGYHFYVYANEKFRRMIENSKKDESSILFYNVITVLFQSVLGSDWLREIRNLSRIASGDTDWNLLFSVKDKNGKQQQEKFYCAYTLSLRGSRKIGSPQK